MPYPAGSLSRAAMRTLGVVRPDEKCAIDSIRPDVQSNELRAGLNGVVAPTTVSRRAVMDRTPVATCRFDAW